MYFLLSKLIVNAKPEFSNFSDFDQKSLYHLFYSEYTPIQSLEQRRRYKADFNADYAEYRELHGVVEKVSRRFAELKERLKQEDQSSPRYKVRKKHYEQTVLTCS